MKKTDRRYKIGIFDSGFGGISILKEIQKKLPEYDYIYLGDTARTPYGSRSQEVIYEFTLEAVEYLFSQGCSLIILACNTASAKALRRIQQECLPTSYPDRRVLGVIIPAAEEAVVCSKNGRIGVLATHGTVSSGTFPEELHKLNSALKVFQQASPLLVPFVEENEHRSESALIMLRSYLKSLTKHRIDTLILACTHYGYYEKAIVRELGVGVTIISEGKVVATKLKDYLVRHPEIESFISKKGIVSFYTTDLTEKFSKIGSALFGKPIAARKVSIEQAGSPRL
jgi:glutamate racemase